MFSDDLMRSLIDSWIVKSTQRYGILNARKQTDIVAGMPSSFNRFYEHVQLCARL